MTSPFNNKFTVSQIPDPILGSEVFQGVTLISKD